MIKALYSLEEFTECLKKEVIFLVYFSHDMCQVCKVLKPKVHEMLLAHFPAMNMYYADMHKNPEIAGQNSVFTAPTVIVYAGHREQVRLSRSFGISELESRIGRIYDLLVG